ncbi:hypothetical protein H1D32_05180 [Anaerobacillus sp. CMMVII]|uniref:hypothetical protein n=1 Tax=Anaerobacillus sp. CMMVII TaxID=2755588 RepID=UPI0021B73273|nr:hypothetical protein [Anaerobacillus sp. CMMVII]MCT8137186.1 hypothetical protein [Anaerobacillus sp. CMMVII]
MRKTLAMAFLVLVIALVGCGTEEENKENGSNEELQFVQAQFDLALPDTNGNMVTVMPNEKTIYAYFTGVG